MNTRLRIGIDLDGVTYQFESAFRAFIADRYPTAASRQPAAVWNWYEELGITPEGFTELLTEGVARGRLFRHGAPMPGAVAALRRLSAAHDIVVVTARDLPGVTDIAERATRSWLNDTGIPFHELHLTGDKASIATDVHLDDSPEIIQAMRDAGRRAVIFDQPWNRHLTGERVTSWAEFASLVNWSVLAA